MIFILFNYYFIYTYMGIIYLILIRLDHDILRGVGDILGTNLFYVDAKQYLIKCLLIMGQVAE